MFPEKAAAAVAGIMEEVRATGRKAKNENAVRAKEVAVVAEADIVHRDGVDLQRRVNEETLRVHRHLTFAEWIPH